MLLNLQDSTGKPVKISEPAVDLAAIPLEPSGEEEILIRRFLSPNAHKLFDFRKETHFGELAATTISEERTLLDYNRLLTLWSAVQNTRSVPGDVAEIGVYKGGSTKFLARCLEHFGKQARIHAFDTFSGHADVLEGTLDGKHKAGLFGDTSEQEVREYLSAYSNISVYAGRIEDTSDLVESRSFSMVHIDVDVYSPLAFCLQFFWSRLEPGGVLVVDDYGFETCAGARHAVDYFRSTQPDCVFWYLHSGQAVIQKSGSPASLKTGKNSELDVLTARLMEKDLQYQALHNEVVQLAKKSARDQAFLEQKVEKLGQESAQALIERKAERDRAVAAEERVSAIEKSTTYRIAGLMDRIFGFFKR